MGFHGGGWWGFLSASEERPKVTWALLRRVLAYARPYRWQIIGMLLMILVNTGLTLLTPLILRTLIDETIPQGDIQRLVLLAMALLLIPALGGVINVVQRRLNAAVGEGVIYDLRVALFSRLQRMSLRFFTNTRVGELMSRLNNDVVGAQNAISNTIVGIITNMIQATGGAAGHAQPGMAADPDQRDDPAAVYPGGPAHGRPPARYRPTGHGSQRADERHDERDPQHRRGAAGQAVWARPLEVERFQERAAGVRDLGIQRAVVGTSFFVIIGLVSAVGTALVYGIGGYLVIQQVFTIGTIVAFGAYLTGCTARCRGWPMPRSSLPPRWSASSASSK